MSLSFAMYMQKKNVRTALRNSIAAVVVRQIPIISMALSTMFMNWDVSFRENV